LEEAMDRLLLRPSEAAELLGLSRSKVYALLAAGELPSVRIGEAMRVPVLELREWLANRRRDREGAAAEAGGADE
jgi:excisionase family DNA binding protein